MKIVANSMRQSAITLLKISEFLEILRRDKKPFLIHM